ncbi:MAG TPA: MarR family transcriptional regulator [Ktedonobacterales bacterium]|nr:MarR family transcriptional regulator [Ktedonobacterales bacterium]
MGPIEEMRYLVLAAQREGNRLFSEGLQPLGLTPSQAEALRVLQDWEPLALVELGSLLVCEQGSPSRLVAGLIAAGYVTRAPSPDDRRKVVLTLTSQGHEMVERVRVVEAALHATLRRLVSDQQVGLLLPLFQRIVADRPAGDALARRLRRLPLPSREDEEKREEHDARM